MTEKELVNKKILDYKGYYKGYYVSELYVNISHSLFVSCLVNNKLSAIKCAKELLITNPQMYASIIKTLKEFPEFNNVKDELDKLMVLL